MMFKKFRRDNSGAANLEFALLIAALSVLSLSGLVILKEHLRPQLVAWGDKPEIDLTLTGSIDKGGVVVKQEDAKTYRIIQLPRSLEKNE